MKEGLQLRVPGERVGRPVLQAMIDATDGGRCVGFLPQHPVFCRDASELYLAWDLWFIERAGWLAFEGAEPYRAMWKPAVEAILRDAPKFVVRGEWWQGAVRVGALSADDYRRLVAFTNEHYDVVSFGRVDAWVRRDQSGP